MKYFRDTSLPKVRKWAICFRLHPHSNVANYRRWFNDVNLKTMRCEDIQNISKHHIEGLQIPDSDISQISPGLWNVASQKAIIVFNMCDRMFLRLLYLFMQKYALWKPLLPYVHLLICRQRTFMQAHSQNAIYEESS